MFCLLPCSLASYHPDLASIWLPPGRLGKLSQLAFFRWLFFNFTFLVRDEGLGLTYTSLEMQTATELLQKRCFFCSFRCIYFNTAHKDGADSYKVKVWPTLQFPLLPFKILTNISYPLKKNPTLDSLAKQETPVGKVLAETDTHCILATSGCSSVGLLSSSSHCCCSLCKEDVEAPASRRSHWDTKPQQGR